MIKKLLALFIAASFLGAIGCQNLNPMNLKTPHARGRFVNMTYLGAFSDYIRYASLENLKPEAIELLKVKRKILVQIGDPVYGPLTIFNQYIQTGEVITDDMFNKLLDMLLGLDQGWYTNAAEAQKENPQVWALNPSTSMKKAGATEQDLNNVLATNAGKAGLLGDKPNAQLSELFLGALIELLRTGIHAFQAMLQQRNWDETQMAAGYQESYDLLQKLDFNNLKQF